MYKDIKTMRNIYEHRMGDIRDIYTKSVFLNQKMFNPRVKDNFMNRINGSSPERFDIDNDDLYMNENCKACGGKKEDYLKRLGKGSN